MTDKSSRAIAIDFVVSEATVESYLVRIFDNLRVNFRTAVVHCRTRAWLVFFANDTMLVIVDCVAIKQQVKEEDYCSDIKRQVRDFVRTKVVPCE